MAAWRPLVSSATALYRNFRPTNYVSRCRLWTQPSRLSEPAKQVKMIEMPRYPTPTSGGALRAGDYIGTLSFAFSGSCMAALAGMDVFGCNLVGAITALGGGTIRDVLLGSTPVFWMAEVEYLYMSIVAATLGFMIGQPTPSSTGARALDWSDTLGVAVFAIVGARHGLSKGLPMLVCTLCGLMTATFGGMTRDVLCKAPPRILHAHAELYASVALATAMSYTLLTRLAMHPAGTFGLAMMLGLSLRAWALVNDVRLPSAVTVAKAHD
eukprot:m.133305 g.133305  ORF g.133305 m.133305 type:complete len:268 (+) comp15947_c0_seq8:66-869(+)